ncbi:MAG: hypothetical protein JJU24_12150 [Natronohydrobacter sp.]|nr:hypothetical protein [Natronohydrobacter sp.]
MIQQLATAQTGQLSADLNSVRDAHDLTADQARRLALKVCGLVKGNRDAPVFHLARKLVATGARDLFALLAPDSQALGREDRAFLDFVISVALRDAEDFAALSGLLVNNTDKAERIGALTRKLSTLLHAYRRQVIPETRHHNVFTAIRSFLMTHRPAAPEPRDGDALEFWTLKGRRDFLTRYTTVLAGLVDYAEARLTAAHWARPLEINQRADMPDNEISDQMAQQDTQTVAVSIDQHLATLENAPAKLLLATERETCRLVADQFDALARFPRSALLALTCAPVQNAVIQALRMHRNAPPDIDAPLAASTRFAAMMQQIDALAQTVEDCLHLIHAVTARTDESALARSRWDTRRQKRIETMLRRKSLADMAPEDLRDALLEQSEALLALHTLLTGAGRVLDARRRNALTEHEDQDRRSFGQKLAALYTNTAQEGVT